MPYRMRHKLAHEVDVFVLGDPIEQYGTKSEVIETLRYRGGTRPRRIRTWIQLTRNSPSLCTMLVPNNVVAGLGARVRREH